MGGEGGVVGDGLVSMKLYSNYRCARGVDSVKFNPSLLMITECILEDKSIQCNAFFLSFFRLHFALVFFSEWLLRLSLPKLFGRKIVTAIGKIHNKAVCGE